MVVVNKKVRSEVFLLQLPQEFKPTHCESPHCSSTRFQCTSSFAPLTIFCGLACNPNLSRDFHFLKKKLVYFFLENRNLSKNIVHKLALKFSLNRTGNPEEDLGFPTSLKSPRTRATMSHHHNTSTLRLACLLLFPSTHCTFHACSTPLARGARS